MTAEVCGFQATFTFARPPVKGSRVRAAWYYNRRLMGTAPKARANVVRSFIAFSGSAPRGFYWCDLMVKPPGEAWKAVRRASIRR